MLKMTYLPCLLVLLLTSCAPAGPIPDPEPEVITKLVDNSCVGLKPILVSKADVLADETAKQILAFNRWGMKRCGWKPAQKKTAP